MKKITSILTPFFIAFITLVTRLSFPNEAQTVSSERLVSTNKNITINKQGGITLDIWYGTDQDFDLGQPQVWINVLGNVTSTNALNTLVYRLNGGSLESLFVDPDSRRLLNPGDFNPVVLNN